MSRFYKLEEPWTPIMEDTDEDFYYYLLMVDLSSTFSGHNFGTIPFGTGIYHIDQYDSNIRREVSFTDSRVELAEVSNIAKSYYNIPDNVLEGYYRDEYGLVSPRYLNIN